MIKRIFLAACSIMLIDIGACRAPNEPLPLRAPGLTAPYISSGRQIQDSIRLSFGIPNTSKVSMWVCKGVESPGQQSTQINLGLGTFLFAGGLSIRTLLNEQLQAGFHSVQWDTRDDRGVLVPEGYYRIYLQIQARTSWLDVLVVRS